LRILLQRIDDAFGKSGIRVQRGAHLDGGGTGEEKLARVVDGGERATPWRSWDV